MSTRSLLLALALLAASCGARAEDGTADTGLSETGDGTIQTTPEPEPTGPVVRARITGSVIESGDEWAVCPGGHRPCLVTAVDLSDQERVQLTARVSQGRLFDVEFEDLPPGVGDRFPLPNECPDKTAKSVAIDEAIYAYEVANPETVAVRYAAGQSSVTHLGVVGDAEPHEQALTDLGLINGVCVVGGFPIGVGALSHAQDRLSTFLQERAVLDWGSAGDAFEGHVSLEVPRIERELADAVRSEFGDFVDISTGVEMIEGTLAEFDAHAADTSGELDVGLRAVCGSVVFSSVPPDLDEFPPLTAEDETLLAMAIEQMGPEGDFVSGAVYSVARRTDDEIVLFGQSPEQGLIDIGLRRVGDEWRPRGWGGCTVRIEAEGLGSAETILDPGVEPDPASTTLSLWILERECASGQAPVDREVIVVPTETDEFVDLITLVAPVPGGAECPGNPWHPVEVELSAPLGDRIVRDTVGGEAVERPWPPEHPDLGN